MAGAAYLLKNNAGVLSEAQCEQKSHVEYKDKSLVDWRHPVLVTTVKAWPSDPLGPFMFRILKPEVTEKLPQG